MKLKDKLASEYLRMLGTGNSLDSEIEVAYLAGFEAARKLALQVCETNDGGADFVGPSYAFYGDMEKIGEGEVE